MEKQIEEMAKAIYNLDHCEGYKDDRGCMYAPSCSVCKYGRENKAKQISELLTKQGYRKTSDVVNEVFADVFKAIRKYYIEAEHTKSVTCELMLDYLKGDLAELKKKYTEDK